MNAHRATAIVASSVILSIIVPAVTTGTVKPGDLITSDSATAVVDLVSPGNYSLVRQGMQMKIVSTGHLEWPPPYKSATEKYSSQVQLDEKGELRNYFAGQPFPLLDPNDPQVALKVMWNFSFRPQYTDDADIRYVEVASYTGDSKITDPVAHFTIGHFAFYNNIGRTEISPIPTDSDGVGPDIRYRFGAFPFLEPAEMRGFGFIRWRPYRTPTRRQHVALFEPQQKSTAGNDQRHHLGHLRRYRIVVRKQPGS